MLERRTNAFCLRNLQRLGVYQLCDTFRKEFPFDKDGNQGWQYVFVSVILNSVFRTCGFVYCWSLCTREFKNSCSYTTKKRIVGEGN